MPTLKYNDGSQWVPLLGTGDDEVSVGPSQPGVAGLEVWVDTTVDLALAPNSYETERATATANTTLTTGIQAIPGTAVTVTCSGPSERFLIIGHLDIQNTAATAGNATGNLFIDGLQTYVGATGQNGQILFNTSTAPSGIRMTPSQCWIVSGLSAGSHTFDLRCWITATGSYQVSTGHTTINVASLGPAPNIFGIDTGSPLTAGIIATANQSQPGATTQVTLGGTMYDTAQAFGLPAMADPANNRIVIPVNGWYKATSRTCWASNATGHRGNLILRSPAGNWLADSYMMAVSTSETHHYQTTEPVYLLAGDLITLSANQGSGAALNLIGSTRGFSFLTVEMCNPPSLSSVPATVTDTGWIDFPAPAGGATVVGGSVPGYRKINGIVYLRGSLNISATTLNQYNTQYTLPAGFRPSTTFYYQNASNTTTLMSGNVTIGGAIQSYCNGSTAAYWSLGNISFPADL